MQKHDSAPAFSLDSVPIVSEAHSLGDVEGTAVTGRSRTKVTTFRAKVTPAAAHWTAFPLPNVTKVTPASDSARTVQLVHVNCLAPPFAYARARVEGTTLATFACASIVIASIVIASGAAARQSSCAAGLLRYARNDELTVGER